MAKRPTVRVTVTKRAYDTGAVGAATDHGVRLGPACAEALVLRFCFARHSRFHLHFTPTSASWLNLIERWFALLSQRQIKRGAHRSVRALETAIREFLATLQQFAGAPQGAIHTCLIFGPRVRHGLPRTCHGEPRRGIGERSWRLSVRSAVSARLVWVARRDRAHAPGRAATCAGIGVGCRRAIIAFDVLRFADRTDLRLGCAFRHSMARDGVQTRRQAGRESAIRDVRRRVG